MKNDLTRSLAVTGILVAALCGSETAYAQDYESDPGFIQAVHLFELWADAQRDYEQIPGVSVGIVHDQEMAWSGGFGYAHLDREEPTTAETIHSICSISKLFTSISVMQLRDEGKLRLDDPVETHLPWFDIQETHPELGPITIEGILTHSAGLPREANWPYWSAPDYIFPTKEQIVERLSGQETLYPAREYFQYSNLGMSLAGQIVESTSGVPYAEYVAENVLGPLALQHTSPEMPEQHRGNLLATGYSGRNRQGERVETPFFQARGVAPAAGYASNVNDLGRFASWQFRLLETGEGGVLERNTLREMQRIHWSDFNTTWGLGFSVSQRDGKVFVGHGGSCPGYRTTLTLQRDEKLAAIAMINASGENPSLFANAVYNVIGAAITDAIESPGKTEPADPALAMYTGTYTGGFGGETAVIPWDGGLATVRFPTDDPMNSLTRLRHIEGHTFRRIRDDDELAEALTFEVNEDGEVVRMWRNGQFSPKVR
jgi:CubicO group peptidase (beta-lactamase class C family)